jgi:hypothetical protein
VPDGAALATALQLAQVVASRRPGEIEAIVEMLHAD